LSSSLRVDFLSIWRVNVGIDRLSVTLAAGIGAEKGHRERRAATQ
jgi:hypothetical protein